MIPRLGDSFRNGENARQAPERDTAQRGIDQVIRGDRGRLLIELDALQCRYGQRTRIAHRHSHGRSPDLCARRGYRTGRNLGSVISALTSSNTTSTGMPMASSSFLAPTMLEMTRGPSASSTNATLYGRSLANPLW